MWFVFGFFIGTPTGERAAPVDRQIKKWPYRNFAYAKAYLYNLENKLYGNHAIIKNGQLDSTVTGAGILLTPPQVGKVLEVTNKNIGGLIVGLSKSYIPHHGIVFYDNTNQPVAYITLCFDCETLRVFPEIPFKPIARELSEKKIKKLLDILAIYKKIILETGLPVFDSPFDYRKN
jgi:hypothetical protein